ncbi:L-fuculose-phosphate aldolase [Candidatus Enterococcus murrayae]|uniref:L-fuculose-phosphate aldolase n=1 Tax=Candidatus Enterococcus murrayae TaxID=2815321 RepID=A0ABS3HFP3_9ENTE|nr:L-fuculose-phosphate aldolase [Enterococcus sp. MJM16]MBO0451740.1 L-fuculose-phosphate aldolase [Enterococcus sp. MJM16]
MLEEEKKLLVEYGKKLISTGLTAGTGGNLSLYDPKKQLIAITPSGIDYFEMTEADIVLLNLEGEVIEGNRKPSSEWQMHLINYQMRGDEIRAVVHAHSTFSSILATCRRDLPASNYMIAVAGGDDVRCSKYATFGTEKLAEYAFEAMQDRYACFLANHGLLTCGPTLKEAFSVATEIERLAGLHVGASLLGKPVILDKADMARVHEQFPNYGQ